MNLSFRRALVLGLALLAASCNKQADERDVVVYRAQQLLARGKATEALTLLQNRVKGRPSIETHRALAVALELHGDYESAAEHYQEALLLARKANTNANDPSLLVGLGRSLAMSGEFARAGKALNKALQAAPTHLPALLLASAIVSNPDRIEDLEHRLSELAKKADAPKVAELQLALGYLHALGGDQRAADEANALAESLRIGNPNVALAMAELHRDQKRLGVAERLLLSVTRTAPKHVPAAIRLVEVALALAHGDVAQEALTRLPVKDDSEPDVLIANARVALFERRLDDGRKLLTQALARLPEKAPAAQRASLHFLMAEAHVAAGEPEQAREELRTVLTMDPRFVRAHLLMADLHIKFGKPEVAIRDLKTLIAAHPDTSIAYPALVTAQLATEDLAGAEDTATAFAKRFPTDAKAHHQLGVVQLKRGKNDEAKASFNEALAHDPGHLPTVRALVSIAMAEKQPEQAAAILQTWVTKRPKDGALLVELARFYESQGRIKSAERYYRQAVGVEPDEAAHWFAMADFYRKQGEPARVQETLQQGLKRDPNNVAANMLLAQAFSKARRAKDAKRTYERVLELRPGFGTALNNLAMLLLDQLDDPAAALPRAQQAYERHPDSPAVADTWGWALHRSGKSEQAVAILEKSTQALGTAEARYHLGMARLGAGDTRRGKEALHKALSMSTNFEGFIEAQRALAQ